MNPSRSRFPLRVDRIGKNRHGIDLWQIMLNGHPIGPMMVSEASAILVMHWIEASRESIEVLPFKLKTELTFEQALGIAWPPRVAPATSPEPEGDTMRQLEYHPWELCT